MMLFYALCTPTPAIYKSVKMNPCKDVKMHLFFLSQALPCSKMWQTVTQLKAHSLFISLPQETKLILSLCLHLFPCSCLNHKGDSLITFDSLTCHRRDNLTCKHSTHIPTNTPTRSLCMHA